MGRGRSLRGSSAHSPVRGVSYERTKVRFDQILSITYPNDRAARIFGLFIFALIVLNVVAVILQTVQSLSDRYEPSFYYFEMVSVAIFTVEYLLRVWSCTAKEKYARPILGRLRECRHA
jgi:voltage-gated potassium channel